jgi:Amt family ammonium transporter
MTRIAGPIAARTSRATHRNPSSIVQCALAALLMLAANGGVVVSSALAQAAPSPELEQRVADLEAYVTNGAPKALSSSGPGHNAWMMTSTALVLFMTLPGLALFYGGLVRRKNVLSVLAQCCGMAGMVTILWWAFGYSLAFAHGNPFLGGLSFAFLKGVAGTPNTDYAFWVSHNVFSMYQLMFAIITPALIVGAIAERMKFSAIMLFMFLWMLVIYFPMAHMVWGIDGLMNGVWNPDAKIKAIDFAGGTVVHMTSGWSALVLCLMLGKRQGHGHRAFVPHSLTLTMVGTGMLWVGWYGFNAGSALAADSIAAGAFTATTLAAGVAGFTWPAIEAILTGKPTVLGFCSGAVAGLVVITPAAGFVTANGAVIIGLLAGVVPYLACTKLKAFLKYDDALDTFGVHGVGGTLGALITGFLATPEANANLDTNLKGIVGHTLWIEQLKAMGFTITISIVGTIVVASIVKALVGLRPDPDAEELGLDYTDHGEAGYHADDSSGHAEEDEGALVAAHAKPVASGT